MGWDLDGDGRLDVTTADWHSNVTVLRYVDGALRCMSPTMTGSIAAQRIQVDVSGGNELGLFIHYGSDDYAFDHADWADARIVCTP